jgi:hypothetical protein
MGFWGSGTDEGDGAHDLLGFLFQKSEHDRSVDTHNAFDGSGQERAIHKAAQQLLATRVWGHEPRAIDTAGAVLIFVKRGRASCVPTLALRIAEVTLEREALPVVMRERDQTPAARKRCLRDELRLVRAELQTRF